MKKQFIVALVASLVLANGASAAFAAKVSDPDNSNWSTTVAARPNNDNKVTREKRIADEKVARGKGTADEKAARATKVVEATNARRAIMTTFKTAMADAIKRKNAKLRSATTAADRRVAMVAFKIDVATANEARTRGLKALTTGRTTTTVKP